MPIILFLKASSFMLLACTALPALAQPDNPEQAQFAVFIRQLEALDRIAAQSETLSQAGHSRYHFDYPRLHADIERIRGGIRDYLTPLRAQPYDPVEMTGSYVMKRQDSGERER